MNTLMHYKADSVVPVNWMDAYLNKEAQLNNSEDTDNINKFIKCPECGELIQMVPALSDMIAAIEDHISIHKENAKSNISTSPIKAPCIRENLTEQVIIQAAMLRETPKDSAWIKLE